LPDVVDKQTRSRMMSGIRGKNTKPELLIRKAIHARGFRYRLHPRDFPGCPDMLFPRLRAAVFIHGCFWHGHDCPLFRKPSTRPEFWSQKMAANRTRDAVVSRQIAERGWRQLVIWECAIRGPHRIGLERTISDAVAWLSGTDPYGEIRGMA